MEDVLELTEETLSCRLFPVGQMTPELLLIHRQGGEAFDQGVPDFLNPYEDDPDQRNAWWRGWHARHYDRFVEDPIRVEKAEIIIKLHYDNLDRTDLKAIGEGINRTSHESGLPAEIAFTIFEEQNRFTTEEKALIISWYLVASFEHKRASGTTYKRLRKIQEVHREIPVIVLRTGTFRSVYHMLV